MEFFLWFRVAFVDVVVVATSHRQQDHARSSAGWFVVGVGFGVLATPPHPCAGEPEPDALEAQARRDPAQPAGGVAALADNTLEGAHSALQGKQLRACWQRLGPRAPRDLAWWPAPSKRCLGWPATEEPKPARAQSDTDAGRGSFPNTAAVHHCAGQQDAPLCDTTRP